MEHSATKARGPSAEPPVTSSHDPVDLALEAARGAWNRALALFDQLRHPDSEDVRTKLRDLDLETALGGPGPGTVTTAC